MYVKIVARVRYVAVFLCYVVQCPTGYIIAFEALPLLLTFAPSVFGT